MINIKNNQILYLLNKLKFNCASEISKLDDFIKTPFEENSSAIIDPIYRIMSSKITDQENDLKYNFLLQAIVVINIFSIIDYKEDDNSKLNLFNVFLDEISDLYLSNTLAKRIIGILGSLRIDIKNFGISENSIEFINSNDKNLKLDSPKWFSNQQGKGWIVTSLNKNLEFKFKCIKNGHIKLNFMGNCLKNKEEVIIPIYINCKSINILNLNNNSVVYRNDDNIRVWHNKPFLVEFDVNDQDEFQLSCKFLINTYKKQQILKILDALSVSKDGLNVLYGLS